MEQDYRELAKAGLADEVPALEVIPNEQGSSYEIEIIVQEFSSICPKTGMPDFGVITITFVPDNWYLELKALKYYMYAYRNMGIFYENVVNKILSDIVLAANPHKARVVGEFSVRGGIRSVIRAFYDREKNNAATISSAQ